MSTLRKLLPVAGLSAALVVSASAFAADYKARSPSMRPSISLSVHRIALCCENSGWRSPNA